MIINCLLISLLLAASGSYLFRTCFTPESPMSRIYPVCVPYMCRTYPVSIKERDIYGTRWKQVVDKGDIKVIPIRTWGIPNPDHG